MATFYPSSGSIDIASVNTLFGRGDSISNYTGTTYYTSTGGPFTFPSSCFGFNAFYGTGPNANRVALSYTFTSSTSNASLNVTSIGGYSAGLSDITITVNSGVYLYATSTGNSGLTLSGGTSGDTITLVNNGYIMGQGGSSFSNCHCGPGAPGGPALSLGFNTTINNTNGSAYIGGGGGSGVGGGGGAGGGAGANNPRASGGAGGGIGAVGGVGRPYGSGRITGNGGGGGGAGGGGGGYFQAGGGGGGRIFPGTGGAGGNASNSVVNGTPGGSANNPGTDYTCGNSGSTGGGGWGARGGTDYSQGGTGYGGTGGNAVTLNGHSVTWVSGCTARVWGAVS